MYNYLFARKNNGTCVLRIEDTDQSRFVKGAIENLFDTMDWAGISFDESVNQKGKYGPYKQSERLAVYKKYIQQLVDEDKAYPCFATAEELERMREDQIANGLDPKYDGRYRDYPKDKAEVRMENEPYVIRMRVPLKGETVINDIVRGEVRFQNELLDDQVILKSDGFPTYHLANVVDDHLMKITHVIRGEEWLPSTPKHVLLYQFFGWDLPQFAHLPLLLNADRSKLSKRQGDVAVEDYRNKGFLPAALVNFVALLGWNAGEGTDQEIFSMQELINGFSLERVNKSGAIFNISKLEWMNGNYIRNLDENQLVAFLSPFLKDAGVDISDKTKTLIICLAVQKRIDKAADVKTAARVFINDTLEIEEQEALDILNEKTAEVVLNAFLEKINNLDELDSNALKPVMKEIQKEQGLKGPLLWKPVRVALTGEVSGPDLPSVIDVFGKDKVCSFIEQALEKYVL